jgi:hypothetical protein
MPTLSLFYGILIRMYWQEHNPPHFHALYGSEEVLITIATLEVAKGSFPRRALALVLEWAALHRKELLEAWEQCTRNQTPQPIDPLD